jgi:hypothetical protein
MLIVIMLNVVAPLYLLSHNPRSLGYLVQPMWELSFLVAFCNLKYDNIFLYILPAVTFSKVVTFWMDSTPIQQYNYSELP